MDERAGSALSLYTAAPASAAATHSTIAPIVVMIVRLTGNKPLTLMNPTFGSKTPPTHSASPAINPTKFLIAGEIAANAPIAPQTRDPPPTHQARQKDVATKLKNSRLVADVAAKT